MKTPAAASGEQVIKLGHASPMTGPIAHIGKDTEYGAQIAVDELNGEGFTLGGKPVKFQLVSEDDQGDPKMATQIAQRMVDAKIAGMIGHLNSGTTIPASKIYADANIGQITPSATNPAFTQQGFKTTFRLIADDVQQGKALADFAVNTLKAKKIAIIDDRSAYGQGLADEFDKAAKALEALHITEIEALNQPFDPNLMNAVSQAPAAEGQESGSVVQVFQKGYKIGDKIIRHAMVVVAE